MSDIIIREAEDKYKGFRYQKLRLAKVILKKINEGNKELRIIGAVEYKDDLYIEEKDSIILEQDKLYSKNFSFCSSEVYR
ncbi:MULTISPECIES: hypothetical protein, partial [Bacteria]|uniref:hypothetical protein n=1 Tax=Bacteria TaxID=2 RepID=UPI003F2EF455